MAAWSLMATPLPAQWLSPGRTGMPDPELWDPCPLPSGPGAPAGGTLGVDGENTCPALFATLSSIVPGSLVLPWLDRKD